MLWGIAEINRFKDDLKTAIKQTGKTGIDFGSGFWKRILEIRESRHKYTHAGGSISDRFPPASLAEEAIKVIREAIKDIYSKVGKQPPVWVDLDVSDGWPETRRVGISAYMTLRKGTGVTISLVTPKGGEQPHIELPANTPDAKGL